MDGWREGWPKEQGWFDCLVDGKTEERLRHKICLAAGKHRWYGQDGEPLAPFRKVEWTGKASASPW